MGRSSFGRMLVALGALILLLASGAALASVRKEGTWPVDKKVKLDGAGIPRAQAVKRLAEAAGWSIVFNGPPSDTVDVHVENQPADKVLELLLSDQGYVATRDGAMISIRTDAAAAATSVAPAAPPVPPLPPVPAASGVPEVPPVPPVPPAPTQRGKDRAIYGGSVTIQKNETVHDVAVFGGSADVYGTATGDVTVMGGSVRIHEGAHVLGDASAVGGSMVIDDGATVDGDVAAVGGKLKRGDKANIGGEVDGEHGKVKVSISDDDDDDDDAHEAAAHGPAAFVKRAARDAGSAITRTALLFVFGAVLLALGAGRMERLQAEVAARPMRSFAMGVVGVLVGVVLVIALCVIVVGIPFAIIGVLLSVLAVAVGLCAALTTLGAALVGHRSQSPYVHLAAGCAVLLVVGAIPFVGGFVKAAAVLVGIGAVVATRAAGLIPERGKNGHPYRSTPA